MSRGDGHTKAAQILDPWGVWNQTPNDEPILIVGAEDWREVLFMALRQKRGSDQYKQLFDAAMRMKTYADENDIPF